MAVPIRPEDLPAVPGGTVAVDAVLIIDDGAGVWKATPQQVVDGTATPASLAARPTSAALAAPTASVLVGQIAAGTGAVATTVQDKLRRFVDVLDRIPVALHASIKDRSNATDLLVYIQAEIDAIIASGGGDLWFPSGTYKITDSLLVSDARKCCLRGDSKELSIIARSTVTGPIVRLTNCSSGAIGNGYWFSWQGLSFRFDPVASTSNTAAIGVSFETGTGDATYGYSNFSWRDIHIGSCYRAITNDNLTPLAPPNVWGWTWDGVAITDLSHSVLYFTNIGAGGVGVPAGGFPNCRIASLYVQGRAATTYSTAPIYCDSIDDWTIDNLEWNRGIFNLDGVLSLQGRALLIGSMRFENVSFATGAIQAFVLSQGPQTVIVNPSVQTCAVGTGVGASILRLGANTLGTILSAQTDSITGLGTLSAVRETTAGNVVYLGQLSPSSGSWVTGNNGLCDPRIEILTTGARLKSALTIGANQVVGPRELGWTTVPTGTLTRTTFVTSTVTTEQLAERVAALIVDLHSASGHGLLGPT